MKEMLRWDVNSIERLWEDIVIFQALNFDGNIIFYNIMENQIFIDKIVNIENEITKIKCSFKMKVLYLP